MTFDWLFGPPVWPRDQELPILRFLPDLGEAPPVWSSEPWACLSSPLLFLQIYRSSVSSWPLSAAGILVAHAGRRRSSLPWSPLAIAYHITPSCPFSWSRGSASCPDLRPLWLRWRSAEVTADYSINVGILRASSGGIPTVLAMATAGHIIAVYLWHPLVAVWTLVSDVLYPCCSHHPILVLMVRLYYAQPVDSCSAYC